MRDRKHERVRRRLRIEILDGDHLVIAIDDVGGQLPPAILQKMQSSINALGS